MSQDRARGAMASCPGPCFALSQDGGSVTVACLAGDLGRIRRRGGALRLAEETGKAPAARPAAPPACRAGLAITAYGVRIGVRANDAGVLARVRDHLPPGWRLVGAREVERLYSLVVPRRRGIHAVYRDLGPLIQARALEELLDSFESDLQLYVAERAARRVFVHAGVVGWRGRAILLPGPSMSGKSTLVAELVRAGATYYSDEYAVLDARGRVHPYRATALIARGRYAGATALLRGGARGAHGEAAAAGRPRGREPLPSAGSLAPATTLGRCRGARDRGSHGRRPAGSPAGACGYPAGGPPRADPPWRAGGGARGGARPPSGARAGSGVTPGLPPVQPYGDRFTGPSTMRSPSEAPGRSPERGERRRPPGRASGGAR